jgi:uncharacterized protein (DUF1810 family)
MKHHSLDRFIAAQGPVYERAATELAAGQKSSHWMWFIFPQLAGLGRSPTAQRYAINSLDEARAYLDHPVLGERLRSCCLLMLSHKDKTAHAILGSPDDLKFRSCLTLFLEAARQDDDRELFKTCLSEFYDGKPDAQTLRLLDKGS